MQRRIERDDLAHFMALRNIFGGAEDNDDNDCYYRSPEGCSKMGFPEQEVTFIFERGGSDLFDDDGSC